MKTEIQEHADFSLIRYAQCWEDADILVQGLKAQDKPRCLSIGSAGDNSFALLAAGASHVTAVEMNPAQIACIQLRRAAYLCLNYEEFLQVLGVYECNDRWALYEKSKEAIDTHSRAYWENQKKVLEEGIIYAGKFENYFRLFREKALPLAHNKKRIGNLLSAKPPSERRHYYDKTWNNLRWRWIFQIFFSRFVMGRLGRDPSFFQYVEGSVASRILKRTRHALVELDPNKNPYLHFILKGNFGDALPLALREEFFEKIKNSLKNENSFRIIHSPLEIAIKELKGEKFGAFNLSDIFEYMNEENTKKLFEQILTVAEPKARIAYWNMLAPRSVPHSLTTKIRHLEKEAEQLFSQDKAFFYSKFLVDEVV